MTFINAKNIIFVDEEFETKNSEKGLSKYYKVKFITLIGTFYSEFPKSIYEDDIRKMIEDGKGLVPVDGVVESKLVRT